MQHDLDLTPLRRRVPVASWWRALASDPQLLMGVTCGALMVLAPTIALPAALGMHAQAGVLWFLTILLALGLGVLGILAVPVRSSARLDAFARANGMVVSRSVTARHYAAAPFREGRRFIRESVRTGDELFVEVGNSLLTDVVGLSVSPSGIRPRQNATPEVFLRARLPALVDHTDPSGPTRAAPGPEGAMGLLTADLDRELRELAGHYTIGVTGRDLTVLGTRWLKVGSTDQLTRAFTLVDILAARATAMAGVTSVAPSVPAPARASVATAPAPDPDLTAPRRKVHPLVAIPVTLGLLITLPMLFGLVMSRIDGHLRGNEVGTMLVIGIFLAVCVGALRLALWLLTARRDPDHN